MLFFWIAAALLLLRLILFVVLHLVHSDYNIVNHAVSDYAVGRTRWLSNVMSWVTAVAWAALAIGVTVDLPHWSDAAGVTVCLWILAAIFVILPFFPTDLEGAAVTRIGVLHYVGAIAWFALGYAIMGNFVRLIQHGSESGFAGFLSVVSWIALVSLIALVAALVIKRLRSRVFGISERIFVLSVNVFYLVAATALASH
jgi:hypothetical protein